MGWACCRWGCRRTSRWLLPAVPHGCEWGARSSATGDGSEDPCGKAGGEGRTEFGAASKVNRWDVLGREDRFRRLGVSTDDERFGDSAEAPAGRDAGNLADGVLAVAAGADQHRVWTTVDTVEDRVVGAVEEVLHLAGERRKIFRRSEDVASRGEHIVAGGFRRGEQVDSDLWFPAPAGGGGFSHLACA